MRSRLELRLRALGIEGVDDGVVQVLDAADLFFADTWLSVNNVPKLEDAGVNFIDVDRGVDCLTAGHLLDVRLKLPDTFTDDLSHNNITLLGDLDVRCGWERYYMVR